MLYRNTFIIVLLLSISLVARSAFAIITYDATAGTSVSAGNVNTQPVTISASAHAGDGAILSCSNNVASTTSWTTPSGWKLVPMANNPQLGAATPNTAFYEKILVSGDLGATVNCVYVGTAGRVTDRVDQWIGTPASGEITDVSLNHTQRNAGGTTNACQDATGGVPNYASDMMAFICIGATGGSFTVSAPSNTASYNLSLVSSSNNSGLSEVLLTGWAYPGLIGTNEATLSASNSSEGATIALLDAARTQVVAIDMVPVSGSTDVRQSGNHNSVPIVISSTANVGDAGLIGCWTGTSGVTWTTPTAAGGDSGVWIPVPDTTQTTNGPSSEFYEKILEANDLGSSNACAYTGTAAIMAAISRAYRGTKATTDFTDVNGVQFNNSGNPCTGSPSGVTPTYHTDLMTFFCGQTPNASEVWGTPTNANSYPLLVQPPGGFTVGVLNAHGLITAWAGGSLGVNSSSPGTAAFTTGTTITLLNASPGPTPTPTVTPTATPTATPTTTPTPTPTPVLIYIP